MINQIGGKGMNNFVIANPEKCIGCRTCEIACVLAHSPDNSLGSLTAATFVPRLKVVKTAKVTTPIQCRQCEDAPCVKVCAARAVVQSGKSVQVIEGRCVGCKTCLMACPYGAMEIVTYETMPHPMKKLVTETVEAFKCDLCRGREGGPACVKVCLTKAIVEVDGVLLMERMKKKREQAAQEMPDIMWQHKEVE
jgi:electron transport protein HydN